MGRRRGHRRVAPQTNDSRIRATYLGLDDDVRILFLNLDGDTLNRIFQDYGAQYGDGARLYARAAYQKWRNGSRTMSGEVRERLLNLVPKHLPFETKYELLTQLWHRTLPAAQVRVEITPEEGIDRAERVVFDHIEALRSQTIPHAVATRLQWLSSGDGPAAQRLLQQAMAAQLAAAHANLRPVLVNLLRAYVLNPKTMTKAQRVVTMPGMVVKIVVKSPGLFERLFTTRKAMSDQPDDEKSRREIARRQNPSVPSRAEDFVDNIFAGMSKEDTDQLRKKAAQEAVRIQMKRAEGNVDQEMAADKVDGAVNAARKLEGTSSSFVYRTEHKSEHGSTELEIKNAGKRGCAFNAMLMLGAPLALLAYTIFRK